MKESGGNHGFLCKQSKIHVRTYAAMCSHFSFLIFFSFSITQSKGFSFSLRFFYAIFVTKRNRCADTGLICAEICAEGEYDEQITAHDEST